MQKYAAAGNTNLNTGSDIANNDIHLQAQDNLTLASVENSEYHYYLHQAKKDFS
ncbi:MAG: hypothetical protein COA63_011060 [Methylophaga sp.]|nr:hypothetical protein [Methylophaga sp.]